MMLRTVAGPVVEPLDLVELKDHLRVEVTADDALLAVYLNAATAKAEAETGRALVVRTLELRLDEWPADGVIRLPYPPARRVDSVKYLDSAGAEQTVDPAAWQAELDSVPARVQPAYGLAWPTARAVPGAVRVRFLAGHLVPFTWAAGTNLDAPGHPYAVGDTVEFSNSGGALPTGLTARKTYYVVAATADTFDVSATAGGGAITPTEPGTGKHYAGTLPGAIRPALLLLAGELYAGRDEAAGSAGHSAAMDLLAPWKTFADWRL